MSLHPQNLDACISICQACQSNCLTAALSMSSQIGGAYLRPAHIRSLMNCNELWQTSTHHLLTESPIHHHLSKICSELHDSCAISCEESRYELPTDPFEVHLPSSPHIRR